MTPIDALNDPRTALMVVVLAPLAVRLWVARGVEDRLRLGAGLFPDLAREVFPSPNSLSKELVYTLILAPIGLLAGSALLVVAKGIPTGVWSALAVATLVGSFVWFYFRMRRDDAIAREIRQRTIRTSSRG